MRLFVYFVPIISLATIFLPSLEKMYDEYYFASNASILPEAKLISQKYQKKYFNRWAKSAQANREKEITASQAASKPTEPETDCETIVF